MKQLITEHLDIWTASYTKKKAVGRGSSKKQTAYGIKKLRELILELAVRGKLVPQNPDDEPASVLLEKIAAEKARLIKEKKIKKPKNLPEITKEEEPFDLPNGWELVRTNDIGYNHGQKKPESDFTYIDVAAIDRVSGKVESPSILAASDAPSRARKIVTVGTVLYSTIRPYLQNICVVEEEFSTEPIASTAFAILHPFQNMPGHYFSYYFRSPIFIRYVESVQTGIAYPAINDKQFFGGVIALPPLAEQHRIVAKVDELMALCDKLEQEQENHQTTHKTLVTTLLDALTSAKDAQDFADTWQRIAEHFDTLFTTEESIDQLKQTILQLAVMGKLLPQNPNDEPASVLLEKIAAEKARLIQEKKIKKQKSLPPITEAEKPFDLPNGWRWSRLGDLCLLQGGFAYKSTMFIESGCFQVLRMGNVRPNQLILEQKEVFIDSSLAMNTQDYEILPKDIVLTMTGTKGKRDYLYTAFVHKSDVTDKRLFLNQRLCLIRNIESNAELLNIVLKDDRLLDSVYASSTGSANQANVGMATLCNWALPVPPLSEQKRIVAKVNELMTLCDALKARLNQAQETQSHIADAITRQTVN